MEDQIKQDLKQAMLERDEIKVSTLRMLISALTYARVQKGADATLDEADIITAVQKEAKKRKEAADSFKSAGRDDAALKEESELKILQAYLPEQISDEELTKIVEDTITELGASSMSDMGRVIGGVMGKVGSRAEGSRVSQLVKEKLA